MTKKCFIFLELTRERSTANEMIDILRKSDEEDSAALLGEYNTSPKFMKYSDQNELKVYPATALKHSSKTFNMNLKPRGKAIIINNVLKKSPLDSRTYSNSCSLMLSPVMI